ncbi:MAG TPA: phosphoribosylamine--glycine ligase [candidate division Zixibacteria bacterium]|nr:phosphoribosylamine--glycine ligase [candidate division Zixibacteria bacterium]
MAEGNDQKNNRRPDGSRSSRGGRRRGRNQRGKRDQREQRGQRGPAPDSHPRGEDQRRQQRGGSRRGGRGRNRKQGRHRGQDSGGDGKWRVLVIGSGGREHALVWKLAQSPKVGQVFAIPGSSGIAERARCVDIKLSKVREIAQFAARNNIDLTVVGPEAPLAVGIVDEFQRRNLKVFGPTKDAAELEWSKAYAKEFMRRYSIPTASFRVFDAPDPAITFCRTARYPLVIKADGLAAGKGVVIANDFSEAIAAIDDMFLNKKFGKAGARIVVEDCLVGQEVSIMAICDGERSWALLPSQDHKRIGEGDTGPNTGGMGAYAPVDILTPELMEQIKERILDACVAGMAEENRHFKGVLYAGLMLTESGPKTLEFNCRFGDPETQVVLPMLESDLAEILMYVAQKKIETPAKKKSRRKKKEDDKQGAGDEPERTGPVFLRDLIDEFPVVDEDEERTVAAEPFELKWKSGAAACVTLASAGYPDSPQSGKQIRGLRDYSAESCALFHAGVKKINGVWTTAGGRVLTVTGVGKDLKEALERAYNVVKRISFDGMQYRRDIGYRGLAPKTELESAGG